MFMNEQGMRNTNNVAGGSLKGIHKILSTNEVNNEIHPVPLGHTVCWQILRVQHKDSEFCTKLTEPCNRFCLRQIKKNRIDWAMMTVEEKNFGNGFLGLHSSHSVVLFFLI